MTWHCIVRMRTHIVGCNLGPSLCYTRCEMWAIKSLVHSYHFCLMNHQHTPSSLSDAKTQLPDDFRRLLNVRILAWVRVGFQRYWRLLDARSLSKSIMIAFEMARSLELAHCVNWLWVYRRCFKIVHSMLGYIGVWLLSMCQKRDLVETRASYRSHAIK